MASSISFLSSSEILGCFAGVSKIKKNQHSDQMTPIPPVSIKNCEYGKVFRENYFYGPVT